MKQPDGLISVLLNPNAREDERDDAAMDLAAYDSAEVENALVKAARDPRIPAIVLDSCGESLAEIWIRRGAVAPLAFTVLLPSARKAATALIRARAPKLLPNGI